MRRRYSSKRMRGRRRKSKKSIIRDIDHSGKGLQFARSISKAMSRKQYDSCVTVQTNHINPEGWIYPGNPPQLDATYMTQFGRVFELQSSQSGQMASFCPFSCLNGYGVNDHEFMRHANMYQQFRIKAIRFEFVPTNAVTGHESSIPISAGYPSTTTTDPVVNQLDANASISSSYWLVKWPKKSTGMFQDFGLNYVHPTAYYPLNTSALTDPSVIKIPITEKLVLTWKPKIMGFKTRLWEPANSSTGFGTAHTQQTFEPCSKPFKFMNIIGNYGSGSQNAANQLPGITIPTVTVGVSSNLYNTDNLRVDMTQPLLSVYDSQTDQFLAPAQFLVAGRWTMHTVFEFRQKRDRAAAVFSSYITETTTGVQVAQDGGATITVDRV